MAKIIDFQAAKKAKDFEQTLENSTYWIPTKLHPAIKSRLTIGKPYFIRYDRKGESFILDNKGNWCYGLFSFNQGVFS